MQERSENRWWVMGIFYVSSAVNYLDRQVMTAVSPAFMKEFHLSYEQYGWILTGFGTIYMLSAPLMGWMLDRLGLTTGTTLALAWWSLAGIARGFTRGLGSLLVTHGLVAIGEAAGIPSGAKASQTFLRQEERAIGSSMSQVGLVVGIALATVIANYTLARGQWRSAFFIAGILGLLWIPLWRWASTKAPIIPPHVSSSGFDRRAILRAPRMWGYMIANVLSLGIFLFWTGWANHYFVRTFALDVKDANRLAPVLQAIALLGAFAGGWSSLRLIRRGWAPLAARRRMYLIGALGMLLSAAVPLATSPAIAVALISVSYFASSFGSVNMYTMPLDAYGGSSAAFAVSLLTAGYGLLQLTASPAIGWVADRHGFAPVCLALAFPPLVGYLVLELTKGRDEPTA
jgi:MFS transporter, ACS family, hexuronate transporter